MIKIFFTVCFFFTAVNAYAYSFDEIEITCPVDGEKFKFKKSKIQRRFTTMLDGQHYGVLISPEPVPKCPKDGFVVFRNDFSDKELRIIKQYVDSQEYRDDSLTETHYWLAYKIQEKISAPEIRFLQYATWEAYNLIDPEKYSKYANELIKAIDKMEDPSNEDIFLKGELYRRLGNFKKSDEIFNALKSKANGDLLLLKKIEQEKGLIEEKISATQRVER